MTLRLIPLTRLACAVAVLGLPLAAQAQQYWHASCAYDSPSPLATGGFYDGGSDAVSGCIRSISEGRAAVLLPSALLPIKRVPANASLRGHAWGFLDDKGRLAVKPIFDQVGDFHHGLAAVQWQGKGLYRRPRPHGHRAALRRSFRFRRGRAGDRHAGRQAPDHRPPGQADRRRARRVRGQRAVVGRPARAADRALPPRVPGARRHPALRRAGPAHYRRLRQGPADRRHRARRIRALERQVGMGGRTALRGNHGPVRLDAGRRPGPRGSRAAGRQGRGHRCRQGLSQPGADGRLLAGRAAARQLRAAGREAASAWATSTNANRAASNR